MYENYNILRNSVEIRNEAKDLKNNKTYVEVFFGEVVNYEYLGESNRLKLVIINQILELDNYIESGESEMFERVFHGDQIPHGLAFYINNIPK